jgi:transcriptional regulator with XRE-family HTH domain
MKFNEKLISLRRAKGLSQEQLANQINVSRQAVSKWETAESQPDLAKLILLSDVFDSSLDELCGRKDETPEADIIQIDTGRAETGPVWRWFAALVLSLIIGFAGGATLSRHLFPAVIQQVIDPITISSLKLYPELTNQKIRVLFSPSVANENFSFYVQKVDSFGQSSTYPVIYNQGTCVSDVLIDHFDGDFTLYAVINDGTYEHTTGLIQISGLDASGYNFEELWNQ